MTNKIYLLLKATQTKIITVPQYTRADGTIVPAHQKTVHYDPDRDVKDVLSGKGTSAQKEAHKKLSKMSHWSNMSAEDQHAHILSSATNIQVRKTHHANVTRFKQSMLAGKVPSPGQYNAYRSMDDEHKTKLKQDVIGKVGLEKWVKLISQASKNSDGSDSGFKTAKPHHTEKKNQKPLPIIFKKRSQMTNPEIFQDIMKHQPALKNLGAKFVGEEIGNETSYDIPVGDEKLRVFVDKDTCLGERVQIMRKQKAEAEKHIQDGTFKQWKHDEYFAKTGLSEDLIKYNYPDQIGGVNWDYPMTEEQANGGKVNPNYKKLKDDGYHTNCQTCVIAYEMRLRGYDVTAKEKLEHSPVYGTAEKKNQYEYMKKLSYTTFRGWFDSTTANGYPKVHAFTSNNFLKIVEQMENVIEAGKRYHFNIFWKNKHSGHIITVGRNDNGDIEFYDPQIGKRYSVDEYNKTYGHHIKCKGKTPPKLYRVDHLMLRKAYASSIFDKGKQ